MEMQQRRHAYRPSWPANNVERMAVNYYPIASRAQLVDTNTGLSFAVVTDRAQGAASLKQGQIEIMLHRWVKQNKPIYVYLYVSSSFTCCEAAARVIAAARMHVK